MIAPRKELKKALEAQLLPIFVRAGFTGPSVLSGHSRCYDFYRQEGDDYKFLTIQFEKRGGPQFRLNFSEANRVDLQRHATLAETHEGRPVALENFLREPCGSWRGHLHPSRVPYFKVFTWFNSRRSTAPKIAAQAVALFPEIEIWWRDRKVGPHLWIPELLGKRRESSLQVLQMR